MAEKGRTHASPSAWKLSRESAGQLGLLLHYATLSMIVIIGGWLRLTGLGRQSLWFDEADIVVRAQRPFDVVLQTFTATGENGPLYNILLALWIRVAGISEIAVRFPSAIAGLLAIPLIYILGRRLMSAQVGLLGAGLLAISPYHVWYSQEAKMYSMVVLLAIVSTLALVEALCSNRRWLWAAYVVATSLMFYTHVATVLVFAAQVGYVALTWRSWRDRHNSLLVSGALLTLPYIPIALWAVPVLEGKVSTWHPTVGLMDALRIIGIKLAVNRMDPPDLEERAAIIFALTALGGLVWLVVQDRVHWRGILLGLLALVPPVGLWVLSIHNSVFSDRYAIVALPAYLLLIAVAITALTRSRWLWPVGMIVMAAILIFSWAPLRDVNRSSAAQKEDWRSAYAHVAERAMPGDVLVLHPGYIATTLEYYEQREPALKELQVATIPTFKVNWLTKPIMIDLLRIQVAPETRFWLVQSPDRVPAEDPDKMLETWLRETGAVEFDETLNGVKVTLFQMPERWWEPTG